MKKNKINFGYYLFIISSLIFFLTIYSPIIRKILNEMEINTDKKFIIVTTIIGSIMIILVAIVNYYILSFISYKIMNYKLKKVTYRRFSYIYSITLFPISIEKLICSLISYINGSVVTSISLYQLKQFNNIYIDFFMKLINQFYME